MYYKLVQITQSLPGRGWPWSDCRCEALRHGNLYHVNSV